MVKDGISGRLTQNLTPVEFLPLRIDVFDVKDVLKKDARHVSLCGGTESQGMSGRTGTVRCDRLRRSGQEIRQNGENSTHTTCGDGEERHLRSG